MNTKKRIFFIDVLKFLALIFMPILHSFAGYDQLAALGEPFPYDTVQTIMNVLYWFTPSIFMLCMGFGLYFARNSRPVDFAKRGLWLLLVFLLVNFFRYPVPTFLYRLFFGELNMAWLVNSVGWLLGNDILAFAGMFFLLYAAVRKVTNSDAVLLIFALVLFAISTAIPTDITIENEILENFLSNFIYTDDTYFTIFTWFIIPVIGYLFYKHFTKSKNQNRFMIFTMIVSTVLFAATYLIISCTGFMQERYLMWGEGPFLFDLPTMLFLMEINFVYIPVIYFASKLIQRAKIVASVIAFEAKNLNTIYCIHWVIFMFVLVFFGDSPLFEANTAAAPFVMGILILVAASLVTLIYTRVKNRTNLQNLEHLN